MIDHVSREVSDLARSARFYDALLYAIGVRRLHSSDAAVAYGIDHPALWLTPGAGGAPGGNGHLSIAARGRAGVEAAYRAGLDAGGRPEQQPVARPDRGPRCFAACLHDPDGFRVEVVSGTG